jgi:hypothetical protein
MADLDQTVVHGDLKPDNLHATADGIAILDWQFKVPRYVRFVDDWPMSGTKVQKYRLRETIAAELEAAGITEAPRLESGASR